MQSIQNGENLVSVGEFFQHLSLEDEAINHILLNHLAVYDELLFHTLMSDLGLYILSSSLKREDKIVPIVSYISVAFTKADEYLKNALWVSFLESFIFDKGKEKDISFLKEIMGNELFLGLEEVERHYYGKEFKPYNRQGEGSIL